MTNYPGSFQSAIVIRALGNKFDDFCEKYEDAKAKSGYKYPTDKQIEVAEYAKKHGSMAAAKKHKVSQNNVYHSINKVSRHYWLNN